MTQPEQCLEPYDLEIYLSLQCKAQTHSQLAKTFNGGYEVARALFTLSRYGLVERVKVGKSRWLWQIKEVTS